MNGMVKNGGSIIQALHTDTPLTSMKLTQPQTVMIVAVNGLLNHGDLAQTHHLLTSTDRKSVV